ncbi:hypothetical protein [Porphyromonas gingivicanis]|uniref:hypothetical protein n=1 Tax=Porphyromonas gingivicanis TaxID=266762 RepID=UPI00126A17E9|nr:hypothetical protein [Porphyromonas gingivicanis]
MSSPRGDNRNGQRTIDPSRITASQENPREGKGSASHPEAMGSRSKRAKSEYQEVRKVYRYALCPFWE